MNLVCSNHDFTISVLILSNVANSGLWYGIKRRLAQTAMAAIAAAKAFSVSGNTVNLDVE